MPEGYCRSWLNATGKRVVLNLALGVRKALTRESLLEKGLGVCDDAQELQVTPAAFQLTGLQTNDSFNIPCYLFTYLCDLPQNGYSSY